MCDIKEMDQEDRDSLFEEANLELFPWLRDFNGEDYWERLSDNNRRLILELAAKLGTKKTQDDALFERKIRLDVLAEMPYASDYDIEEEVWKRIREQKP